MVTAEGVQLAATDIKVTASKTSVDMISGNFVSDVNMVVEKSHQPGLLTASYTYDRRLSDKLPVSDQVRQHPHMVLIARNCMLCTWAYNKLS